VPKTVQIRDLDDEIYAALERKAAEEGMSVPAYLKREATRLALQPSMIQWLASVQTKASAVTTESIIEALDEVRGEWSDGHG
jgi:plasmid stability protein